MGSIPIWTSWGSLLHGSLSSFVVLDMEPSGDALSAPPPVVTVCNDALVCAAPGLVTDVNNSGVSLLAASRPIWMELINSLSNLREDKS